MFRPSTDAPLESRGGDEGAMAREILIARLVDARANDHDWIAVRVLADADPLIWQQIAATQRDAALLVEAARPAALAAERVALPMLDGPVRAERGERDEQGEQLNGWPDRLSALRSSRLGWAIAAMVALAWTSTLLTPKDPRLTAMPGNAAGLAASTPDEALSNYLEKGQKSGRVVTELPQRIVLESRPAPEGQGYEVLYVRQILERAVVDDLYRFGMAEDGSQALIRARPTPPRAEGRIGL
ncbi:MAG: hypothetical protein ACT4PL_08890 [Phycisphaerales bacterium]